MIPDDVVWLDVIVPRDAAGWSADVHGPMRWLGGHLAAIVRSRSLVDAGEISTHEGPMLSTPWSTLVCFDGIGAGELLVDGAKLVGISQRRTRDAARLQCCWYTRYDSAELVSLLAEDHRPPVADLAPVATLSVPAARAIPDLLVSALNSALNA